MDEGKGVGGAGHVFDHDNTPWFAAGEAGESRVGAVDGELEPVSAADDEIIHGIRNDGEGGACGRVGGARGSGEFVEALIHSEHELVEGGGGVVFRGAPWDAGGHYFAFFLGGCLR